MAAKKRTTKKAPQKRGNSGATATLDPKTTAEEQVVTLPRGQSRDKDGTITLKAGAHDALGKAVYIVHGSRIELEGDVFVADFNVNWLPVTKCTCKADRPDPIELLKLPDGKWAAKGTCNNAKCNLRGKTYVWLFPANRFQV